MNLTRRLVIGMLIAASVGVAAVEVGAAVYRQRYSSWNYHSTRRYHYRKYYYKPYTSYTGYQYHYCIHYPTTVYPRRANYVYYYNPTSRTYWGRYDLEKKGYSMLAEKDRKGKLEDIPESAFPKPGEMPPIPGSKDKTPMLKIEKDDLPVALGDDLPEIK